MLTKNSVRSTVDTSWWTNEDRDPFETEDDERIIRLEHSISPLSVELAGEVSATTLEGMREA